MWRAAGRGFDSPRLHHYSKSQPLSVGIFFARFPSENRNDVASVASAAARFPTRFPPFPLSVISRDASARDATSSIFKGLQAAGSISNLVMHLSIDGRFWKCHSNSNHKKVNPDFKEPEQPPSPPPHAQLWMTR